jgi:hypothetical protein
LCFLSGKGIGFCTQGSLSLPCSLAMESSLVYFVFLLCFSGSSSTSSLSEASFLSLPLSVSALEIDTLLGSLTDSEDSTTVLCFFFFFLKRVPLSIAH